MKKTSIRSIVIVVALIFVSALMLVYTRHESRMLYAKVQKKEVELRRLDAEAASLDAERGALLQKGRVDEIAKRDLGMVPISNQKLQIYSLIEGGNEDDFKSGSIKSESKGFKPKGIETTKNAAKNGLDPKSMKK